MVKASNLSVFKRHLDNALIFLVSPQLVRQWDQMIVVGFFQMKSFILFCSVLSCPVMSCPFFYRVCSVVTVTSPDLAVTDFINNCEMDQEPHPGFTSWCSQTQKCGSSLELFSWKLS